MCSLRGPKGRRGRLCEPNWKMSGCKRPFSSQCTRWGSWTRIRTTNCQKKSGRCMSTPRAPLYRYAEMQAECACGVLRGVVCRYHRRWASSLGRSTVTVTSMLSSFKLRQCSTCACTGDTDTVVTRMQDPHGAQTQHLAYRGPELDLLSLDTFSENIRFSTSRLREI